MVQNWLYIFVVSAWALKVWTPQCISSTFRNVFTPLFPLKLSHICSAFVGWAVELTWLHPWQTYQIFSTDTKSLFLLLFWASGTTSAANQVPGSLAGSCHRCPSMSGPIALALTTCALEPENVEECYVQLWVQSLPYSRWIIGSAASIRSHLWCWRYLGYSFY